MRGIRWGILLLPWVAFLSAQDLKEFEKKVTEFTLGNGLHFILVERHDAPVISFSTYVGVGAVDDPAGQTGMSHLVARMTLKGTDTIGTRNWPAEKQALDDVEAAYGRLEDERVKGPRADLVALSGMDTQWKLAQDRARGFTDAGEFERIIAENGGTELIARPLPDFTTFGYNLPSNRMELWFLLESQRLTHPVFRDFYAERAAALEERQANVDTKLVPRLNEALLTMAFSAHPYRQPETGWPSDIANMRRTRAQNFFETYYVPGNMVMALVGDVNPADAKRLAEKYFGPMPARPMPRPVFTQEPQQIGPRSAVVGASSQPVMLIGYKRPSQRDKDDMVFDLLQMILAGGRTGLLQKELVQEKAIAQQASAQATFPGGRYTSLFVFGLSPQPGHTMEDTRKALDDLLTRFVAKRVDDVTLSRAKAQIRSLVIHRLESSAELAAELPLYYAGYGDWRHVFTELTDMDKMDAEDIQRVAVRYFTPSGRTVVYSPAQGRPDTVQPLGGQQ